MLLLMFHCCPDLAGRRGAGGALAADADRPEDAAVAAAAGAAGVDVCVLLLASNG